LIHSKYEQLSMSDTELHTEKSYTPLNVDALEKKIEKQVNANVQQTISPQEKDSEEEEKLDRFVPNNKKKKEKNKDNQNTNQHGKNHTKQRNPTTTHHHEFGDKKTKHTATNLSENLSEQTFAKTSPSPVLLPPSAVVMAEDSGTTTSPLKTENPQNSGSEFDTETDTENDSMTSNSRNKSNQIMKNTTTSPSENTDLHSIHKTRKRGTNKETMKAHVEEREKRELMNQILDDDEFRNAIGAVVDWFNNRKKKTQTKKREAGRGTIAKMRRRKRQRKKRKIV